VQVTGLKKSIANGPEAVGWGTQEEFRTSWLHEGYKRSKCIRLKRPRPKFSWIA